MLQQTNNDKTPLLISFSCFKEWWLWYPKRR